MTGDTRPEAVDDGADLHMIKPVDPAVLFRLIDRFGRLLDSLGG